MGWQQSRNVACQPLHAHGNVEGSAGERQLADICLALLNAGGAQGIFRREGMSWLQKKLALSWSQGCLSWHAALIACKVGGWTAAPWAASSCRNALSDMHRVSFREAM